MNELLKRIIEIRKNNCMFIDTTNTNRYRIVLNENDGSKTAYYFSSPIYNSQTNKLIDLRFSNNIAPCLIGSNAQITFSDTIKMSNFNGSCYIALDEKVERISDYELKQGGNVFLPTTNGFVYKTAYVKGEKRRIILKTDRPFFTTRYNNKYWGLMIDKFTPFVYVSAIGIEDEDGQIIEPLTISVNKVTEYEYEIVYSANCDIGRYFVLEINLYEKKLIQDTTVESKNPQTNNAFGGVAFLGNTSEFGEQWLYSRIDYMKMTDIGGCHVKKIIAYIPKLNNSTKNIDAYKVSERFCSFGATWENKKSESNFINCSDNSDKYIVIDISQSLTHELTKQIISTNGLILKPQKDKCQSIALTTGDSCFLPQIYEINYF